MSPVIRHAGENADVVDVASRPAVIGQINQARKQPAGTIWWSAPSNNNKVYGSLASHKNNAYTEIERTTLADAVTMYLANAKRRGVVLSTVAKLTTICERQ